MNKVKLVVTVMIIGLICVVGSSAKANPDANPYYDSVEELLVLMKVDENLNHSFAQIRSIILQQFQEMMDGELTAEQSQIMEKYMGKLLDLMQEEMRWDKIKVDFIHIYMSVYTEEEIQELIKFYHSPVGQKTIEKTPVLLEQTMEISQKYMMNIMPKIEAIAEEMKAELKTALSE